MFMFYADAGGHILTCILLYSFVELPVFRVSRFCFALTSYWNDYKK